MPSTHIQVPDAWVDAADEQDIALTEYCRRMIRAGRRQFGYDYPPTETPAKPHTLQMSPDSATSMDAALKEWLVANLSSETGQDPDALAALLEDDLVRLLDELQDDGRVTYRRGQGGYLKVVDDE